MSIIIYFLHTYRKAGGLYKEIESYVRYKDPPEIVWPELKKYLRLLGNFLCFKYIINIF